MKTFADRIRETGGYTSGFDYLRVGLAISVLAVHAVPLSYGGAARMTFFPLYVLPFTLLIVPAFFALSGYLVASSFERNSLPIFIGLRVLRIFPALVVEVVASAIIIGAIFTVLPLKEYFKSPIFVAYFHNIYGFIHYYLPGVFPNNPYPGVVNGSLWTVPHELECYMIMGAFGIFLIAHRRGPNVTLLAVFGIAAFTWFYVQHATLARLLQGQMLVLGFVAGVAIYRLRDFMPFNFLIFVLCLVVSVTVVSTKYELLVVFPMAYAVAYLGLLMPPKSKLLSSGDYSYGIYLYAFPIQQSVVELTPASLHVWWVNIALSLPLVALFAAFSWHFIEKPTLRLKQWLRRGQLDKRDSEFVKPSPDGERSQNATASVTNPT
ncbi:acyltransferase [Bosea sp. CCNWLW174]|uniref:acyltransferase family protein n=1 Tax=unclassified Bosea (in: a-proteobacteria) TaxID=2653178 RepID=UPI0030144BA3